MPAGSARVLENQIGFAWRDVDAVSGKGVVAARIQIGAAGEVFGAAIGQRRPADVESRMCYLDWRLSSRAPKDLRLLL